MEKAIIGKKLGMTQVFDETGIMIPVTVVEAGPMTVVRKKTLERDGYAALVTAFGAAKEDALNQPEAGLFKKAKLSAKKVLKEFKFSDCEKFDIGSDIKCDIFSNGDVVDVSGVSKGHGFAGTIKRWGHSRLKETHGTGPVVRHGGSQGARSTPGRVIKGMKMPGQYGSENVTVQNLKIVKVDLARNVLLIKGAVPGPNGGLVTVKQAVKQ
ncbi:MAG: 50S ribosomal protein L3 [Firmicutes bacterium]|nr:50S ribosomal protein L3 [Bacillota bacterium]